MGLDKWDGMKIIDGQCDFCPAGFPETVLERDEGVITMTLHLLPWWYADNMPDSHIAEHEGVASHMDELHLRKIDLADEIFVVNFDDYIGESTSNEINYADNKGKLIRWFTNDPIGEKVKQIISKALTQPAKET